MISIISKLVNAYIIITIILNVCDGLKKLKVKLNPLNANISMAWGGGGTEPWAQFVKLDHVS